MEQLLASAASDDEAEDSPVSVPSFTIPEQHIEQHGSQQVSASARSAVGETPRHASSAAASDGLHSSSRLRGLSWLLEGGVANLLVPVLVLTHLALFGLGFYIGRRTNLVKTM
ncbi:hypothetical protein GBAR_LOCUS8123 [Geodia barretti]|nr:hypothetical protein GBAR_LOCUS8123 [Geodia barretti]